MECMKVFICLLSAFLILVPATKSESEDKPKLKIKAPRSVFMKPTGMRSYAPVSVRLRGELTGKADDPEKYYCLEEEWEWGDETESRYEPDCDPYEEGAELKRNFSGNHTFRYPGTYKIYFRLNRGKKTILTGQTTIQLRGS
jgi:hypothetical protein